VSNKRQLAPFWVTLLFGLMSFFNVLSNPRLATLHGSDVLQLIATGMCFGVALATLVVFLRGRRSS
jgi:hypothetical protein